MNLNELFPIQAELDHAIMKKHGLLDKDLYMWKVQALKVEIAELDNETRFFKFWSNKKMDRSKALEEFVDCIHFALSIGNDLGYTSHEYKEVPDRDMTKLSLGLTNLVTILSETRHKQHIEHVINLLLKYGYQLGFTEKEVIQAYMDKNEVNYERQASNY
jgi:dimeric dUTPase (all-alpha-NTP-PPase superfamily)